MLPRTIDRLLAEHFLHETIVSGVDARKAYPALLLEADYYIEHRPGIYTEVPKYSTRRLYLGWILDKLESYGWHYSIRNLHDGRHEASLANNSHLSYQIGDDKQIVLCKAILELYGLVELQQIMWKTLDDES